MSESLKEKAVNGVIWSSIGKFGSMLVSFMSNLVLARLLMPEDWGCIGMLTIFITISQVFVSSGLGTALIQKKDISRIDYTTVFYYNLVVAVLFILILFFCAPAIARFYEIPLLCDVLRVQSLSLLLQSFSLVPAIQLQKELNFKSLNIRNLIASICGAIVSIVMAYNGFGVWSLVVNGLFSSLCGTLLLWKMSTWRPTLEFSWTSFRQLFSFGGIMLLSSLVESIFANIQGLIIGKMYSSKNLGYYDQARKLEQVPSYTISAVLESVSFPIVSKIQDDKKKVKEALSTQFKVVTYINFPLMVLLVVIAEPLVVLLYGEKWLPSVPYFQLFCIGGLVFNISTLSTSTIKALGEAKVYFVMQLIKRIIGLALIVCGAFISIWALLGAVVLNMYISLFINMYIVRKYVGYGFRRFFRDLFPVFMIAFISVIPIFLLNHFFTIPVFLAVTCLSIIYVVVYIAFSALCKVEVRLIYWDIFKNKVLNKIPNFNKNGKD